MADITTPPTNIPDFFTFLMLSEDKKEKFTASLDNKTNKYKVKNDKNKVIDDFKDYTKETFQSEIDKENIIIIPPGEHGGKKSRKSKRRVRKTRRLNKKHTKK